MALYCVLCNAFDASSIVFASVVEGFAVTEENVVKLVVAVRIGLNMHSTLLPVFLVLYR